MLETQAQQEGEVLCQTTEFGVQINLPRKFGAAGDRIIQLREALTIASRQSLLKADDLDRVEFYLIIQKLW